MSLTEKQISEKLRNLGISANLYGFTYIKEALTLLSEDETLLKRLTTTQGLYRTIARKYNTISSRVERDIRHAKERALTYGDITELKTIGVYKEARMKNGEFLGAIYECMKYEE